MPGPSDRRAGPTGPNRLVNALDRFLDRIADLFRLLAALCLGVMVALNLYNVVSRSVLGVAYGWIFNWTLLLFVWMLMLGLFVYMRSRRDVVVDIFMTRLPALPRRLGALFVCAVGIAVMAAVLRGAPALLSMQRSNMEAIALPMYLRSGPLFVAAGLVLVSFASDFVSLAMGWRPAFPRQPDPRPQGAIE